MDPSSISFDNLPSIVGQILAKVEGIERRLAAASAPPPAEPEYVTIKEARVILRNTVTEGTFYNWKHQGRIAYTKVGRKLLFKRSDVEAILRDGYASSSVVQKPTPQVEAAPVIRIRKNQKRKG
jgi:excisionase family DNA binding protein